MRLQKLPDGSYIDPSYIRMERCSITHTTFAPRVIIHIGDDNHGDRRVIDCESNEDAEALCDRIAEMVNV